MRILTRGRALVRNVVLLGTLLAAQGWAAVTREDFRVPGEKGIELSVREVRDPAARAPGRPPILLVHGLRVPGRASFDLPVEGGSLAADLARAGHAVYVMDARGYGGSTRPKAMSGPIEGRPLVTSHEVVRDLQAVVAWVKRRTRREQVALLGWATGGHWSGMYASLHPEDVSHLVLHNTLYGGASEHPMLGHGTDLEDPKHPGRFNVAAYGRYRLSTAASLVGMWDRSIPLDDKAAWRDPKVLEAFQREALASDPTSASRTPPSFRAPTGAMEDSFYLATGRQLWDAAAITAKTLLVRSGNDFWSRPEDYTRLQLHLANAADVRFVELPQATHFVHLDRPERGRSQFLEALLAFLAS